MDFDRTIATLNTLLKKKHPNSFNSSWILRHAPQCYRFIHKSIRMDMGGIDWDTVTHALDGKYQKRWMPGRSRKHFVCYEDSREVEIILEKYRDKLYLFIAPINEYEKHLQHRMIISLVRVGQKGNVCAQQELIKWVRYITDDWISRYPQMYRWNGYPDEVEDKIVGCMRRYRYPGSFLGYLFKTLEYSARGLPPLYSLDDTVLDGAKRRIDYVAAKA